MNNDIFSMLNNPRMPIVKNFIHGFIGDKTNNHNEIIERISHSLISENDIKAFAGLVNEIYQESYKKFAEHYNDALQKSGYKINFK